MTSLRRSNTSLTQGRRILPPRATDCVRHLTLVSGLKARGRTAPSCHPETGLPLRGLDRSFDGWSCNAELFPYLKDAAIQVHHSGNRSRDRGFIRAGGVGAALDVIDNSSFMHDRTVGTSPTEVTRRETDDWRLRLIVTETATMQPSRASIYAFPSLSSLVVSCLK